MRKTSPSKIGMHLFTLSITLLLLTILTACGNAGNKTDTSSDKENESKQTINKDEKFVQLENEFDAQISVYAMDTGTNQTIEYRPNERFAYSSTFKPLAAAILLKQNNIENLEKVVTYTNDDLVTYSPVTEKHVDAGLTLLEISEAAIRKSDNTAGNLLLEAIGGPDKFEHALRDIGDDVTQPERYETELNEFTPGNKRDTSTPRAMATNLKKVALGDFLPDDKRELLIDWMTGNESGDPLIRAGAPEKWTVVDKSGAGTYGTRNDIAVVWPPNKEPIVIAIMSRHDTENAEYDDALIAKAAEITLNAFK
ncbi:class A beta-lactamase [Lentibacillus amyloliquefaciens]|uniref:Beta-lactamase n=1 Tax=Lentibacillus amyloliquefaciens TaxID=1472767 RepID=A0A0U3WIM7_9BACI|nr:class A beta-lactamase [Lentibacillus amyloliquefaciens]ALX49727.1 class A beta-lactamase [Lentibacillus amyloliquefaciens]